MLQGICVDASPRLCGFTEVTIAKQLPALPSWSFVCLIDCFLARAAWGSLKRLLPVIASRETGRSWTLVEHRLEKRNPREEPVPGYATPASLPLTGRRHNPPGADKITLTVPDPCWCCESKGEERALLDLLIFFFAGSAVDFWRFPGQLHSSPTLLRPST